MQRLIITGANGSGKSHLARRLGAVQTDMPVMSFDALKLTQNWQPRPRTETAADLAKIIARDRWILEGGPSLLPQALPRADAVIWLDLPDHVRAWRLLRRPWKNLGQTRPELPPGNSDWPIAQYRFAWRSLKNGPAFRDTLAASLAGADQVAVYRCKTKRQIESAALLWNLESQSSG